MPSLPDLSPLPHSLECLILQLYTVSLYKQNHLSTYYHLYPVTIQKIMQGLLRGKNPNDISDLSQQPSISDSCLPAHYIKLRGEEVTSKNPSVNLSVLFDPTTKKYSLIIKAPEYFNSQFNKPLRYEGSFKQATESLQISLSNEGDLEILPIVSFRANLKNQILENAKFASDISDLANRVSEKGNAYARRNPAFIKLSYKDLLSTALISSPEKQKALKEKLLIIEKRFLNEKDLSHHIRDRNNLFQQVETYSRPLLEDFNGEFTSLITDTIPTSSFKVLSYDSSMPTPPSRLNQTRYIQPQQGKNLYTYSQDLKYVYREDKPELLLKTLVQFSKQVGEQITDLHKKGITHFDIKPENVLFSEENMAFKLIDIPTLTYPPTSVTKKEDRPKGLASTPGISSYYAKNPNKVSAFFSALGFDNPYEKAYSFFDSSSRLNNCGHAQDCYAYLRCLSHLLSCYQSALQNNGIAADDDTSYTEIKDFLRKHTHTLIENISQTNTDKDWDGLTVSQVQKDFETHFQDNPLIQSYLAIQPSLSHRDSCKETLANFGIKNLVQSLSSRLVLTIMDFLTYRSWSFTPQISRPEVYTRIQALEILQELDGSDNITDYLKEHTEQLTKAFELLEKTKMVNLTSPTFQTVTLLKSLVTRNQKKPVISYENTHKNHGPCL